MLFYLTIVHIILSIFFIAMTRRYHFWIKRHGSSIYRESSGKLTKESIWIVSVGYALSVIPLFNLLMILCLIVVGHDANWKPFWLKNWQKRWHNTLTIDWFKGIVTPAIAIKPHFDRPKGKGMAHPEDAWVLYIALFLVILTIDYELKLKYRR